MSAELLRKANEALMKAKFEKEQMRLNEDRKYIVARIGEDLANTIKPTLEKIASDNGRFLREAINEIKQVKIPDIMLPEVRMPEPKINVDVDLSSIRIPEPKVNVSPILKIPEIIFPKEMDIKGWVSLMGVDLQNPLPVQLRDASGNPVKLFENLTTLINQGSGGGGKRDFLTIKGFSQSAYAEMINADGRLRVSNETVGSGITDNELRASSVPVAQVSGANFSVNVATQDFTFDTKQVSGSIDSVYVTGFGASVVVSLLNGDGVSIDPRDRNWTVTETVPISTAQSFEIKQVSGAVNSVVVNDVLVSVPVFQVSGASFSVNANIGLSDVELRASALDVKQVSGSINSTQVKLIARTTNPTAIADGSSAFASSDKLGRTLTRPFQVRDLISTAYISIANGTETTLLAGVAGSYLDLMYVMGTNNSDVAVTVDLRAVTAGNIQTSIRIPANGTAGVSLPLPIPQDETGNNWTADLPDITGTTVTLSALFSKEI